ncbi:MAG: polysaccharide biosynthesis C-terminal domain-containing protein, partial [Candidatus Cloacimonas sp.]|nr:polysaccharide biosynthesis C-terminal domain-containing protein [Candidatus Cloacimonas sp.]
GKTRVVMYNSLFLLISNAILNYLLIIKFGMKGAAMATVIVTWLSVIIYLILIGKVLKLNLRAFFPLGKIAKNALLTIICAFFCMLIIKLGKSTIPFLLAGGIVFMIAYLFLGKKTGVILDYDIQLLKGIFTDAFNRLKK